MERQQCGAGSGHHGQHGFGFGMGGRGESPWAQAGAWTGAEDWRAWAGQRRGGPPPWLADIVRSFGGPDLGQRGGPRVRRGDVRLAILDVLAEQQLNGYQVIQQIGERTGGIWKPSPGSVYPTIQQLEDEGLIRGAESDGRRLLELTDQGRAYLAENPDEVAAAWRPFQASETESHAISGGDLKPVIGQLMGALWQVRASGTTQQQAEAAQILSEARRRIYALLASEDEQ